MSIKYSFIVPAYNIEKFLPVCIDSLLDQTYKSFEILIIDDGSTDKSGQVADEYQRKYPKIVKAVHQSNTGQGGARNHGVEIAQGEFILFVDGDDYVSSNMLEIIEKYKQEHDDDILLFNWELVKERKCNVPDRTEFSGFYNKMALSEYIFEQPSPCRKVYKASLFHNKQLKFPEKIYYEDLALAPCFVLDVNNIGVIYEKLYFYVQHQNSTMHSKDVNRILDIIPAFDYIICFFKENQIFDMYHAELEWLAIQHVLYYSTVRISYIEYNSVAVFKLFNYMREVFPEYKKNPYLGTENKFVNYEELEVLMKDDYDSFDSRFYRKRRMKKRIKDFMRSILINFKHLIK